MSPLLQVNTIESLINEYSISCKELSFKYHLGSANSSAKSRTQILDMFFTAIQQFALFSQRISAFTAISPSDQQVLLRGSVLEMCFIWSAYMFDTERMSWPDRRLCRGESPIPTLAAADLKPLISQDLFEKHMNFIKSIKEIDVDEPTIMLLSVIVLINPDRAELSNCQSVSQAQETYLILLRNYMNWRYGERATDRLYPKLLLKLPDLREIAEALTDYQLLLCREEIEEVHHRLANLKLDSSSSSSSSSCSPPSTASPSSSFSSASHSEASQSHFFSPWSLRRDALPIPSERDGSFCPDDELSTSSESSS